MLSYENQMINEFRTAEQKEIDANNEIVLRRQGVRSNDYLSSFEWEERIKQMHALHEYIKIHGPLKF